MKRLFLACLIFGMLTQSINCMETEERVNPMQMMKALMAGAGAGCIEVIVDQPLITIKNLLQLPKEKRQQIELNRKTLLPTLYRGLGANLAGMGPATALQIGFETALKGWIKGNDLEAQLLRASTAGAFSAVAATPIELVIVQQQLMKCSAATAIKTIARNGGLSSFYRAGLLVAAREGLWTPAYFTVYPIIAQMVEATAQPLVAKVTDEASVSKTAGAVGGGIVTGVLVAVLTHPFDTIKTVLQADYTKAELKGAVDAVKAICSEVDEKTKEPGGMLNLWKGVKPRATRAAIAIPLMMYVAGQLKKQMEAKT